VKKKYIIFVILVLLLLLVFVGCSANLKIKSNNTAVLKATIPNEELEAQVVSDTDMDEYINTIFAGDDVVKVELKSYRKNKNGNNIKVKITPIKDVEKTYVEGFAIGTAFKVFKEFTLDNFGKANWRHSKDKVEDYMDDGLLFAINSNGDKLSYDEVEKIIDKTGLRVRKAVFIKGGFYKTHVKLPGQVIIAFSKTTDIKQDNKSEVILGSGDALIIYKNNLYITVTVVIIFFILGLVLFYSLRKKNKSKVSKDSPQVSLGTDFCKSCGTIIEDNDKFCRKCGTPVKKVK